VCVCVCEVSLCPGLQHGGWWRQ